MPMIFDVVVIGGGITGWSAALAAQNAGASTCLLRAAPGTTAVSSGAWSGPLRAELRVALAAAGYPLLPVAEPIAHQRGGLISCDFAGASHIQAVPNDETVVCGIAGLPHFNAPALARLWRADQPMRAIMIEWPGTPAGGWSPISLAASVERAPEILRQLLQPHAAHHIIMPAVLGVHSSQSVVSDLAQAGITASEALALAPSIPGWRLQHALELALAGSGIQMFSGRAILERAESKRVHTLRVGNESITAHSFVLATGKFTAGGLSATDVFQESVLDLPIWLEHLGDIYTAPDPLPLTDPVRSEHQPLLLAGVQTDEMQRPVDRSRAVVFENVFAAGTIRAGWSAADSGLGHCSHDGWTAGVNAAS